MKRYLAPALAAILLALTAPAIALASNPATGTWRTSASSTKAKVIFTVRKTSSGYRLSKVRVSADVRCVGSEGRAFTERVTMKLPAVALTPVGQNWRYLQSRRQLRGVTRFASARLLLRFNADRRARATITAGQDGVGANPLECSGRHAMYAAAGS